MSIPGSKDTSVAALEIVIKGIQECGTAGIPATFPSRVKRLFEYVEEKANNNPDYKGYEESMQKWKGWLKEEDLTLLNDPKNKKQLAYTLYKMAAYSDDNGRKGGIIDQFSKQGAHRPNISRFNNMFLQPFKESLADILCAIPESMEDNQVAESSEGMSDNLRRRIEEKKSAEFRFLLRAYEVVELSEPGNPLVDKIGEELGLNRAEAWEVARSLSRSGLIEVKTHDGVIKLTPNGRREVENAVQARSFNGSVFIVHGRDSDAKYQLKDLLRDWRLRPVILHEQPNLGRAIIEKFEDHSEEVRCAIVLLTPDDKGCLVDTNDWRSRARQNVIFEFGYFFAKLGRGKVICLHKGDIELPSDVSGIIYIPFENDLKKEVYSDLRKELKAVGFTISD